MPNYYGQRGDDFLLWLAFQNKDVPGYFVEVGALDGKRFSNTYSFEEQGWTGICIEAHPDYLPHLNRNRPNSHVVFAAAGESNGDVTFYLNKRGSLSTLDNSQEEHFKSYGKAFTGFEETTVPMKTLTSILDDANAPHTIDILSIDVEGAEMRVLAGMDWDKYTTNIIIIEVSSEDEAEMDSYFETRHYHKARRHFSNVIYCRNEEDAERIAATEVNCVTILTPHILDEKQEPEYLRIENSKVVNPNQQTTGTRSKSLDQSIKHFVSRIWRFLSTRVG